MASKSLTSGEDALYELLFASSSPSSSTTSAAKEHDRRITATSVSDESAAYQYLQELNAFHLDRLSAEPFVLRDSLAHCGDEIKSLAFANYKTFVRTAQCSREIYADFGTIDARLDELVLRLPAFAHACDSFTKNIQVSTIHSIILILSYLYTN